MSVVELANMLILNRIVTSAGSASRRRQPKIEVPRLGLPPEVQPCVLPIVRRLDAS